MAVLDASGEGTFQKGRPVSLEIHAGTEQSLKNPAARYPLEVSLHAGDTLARAEGTIDDPADLSGLDIGVHLEGPDLNQLGEILQIPLPETPPYQLSAQASHQENRWNFVALRGEVGDSDLSGDITLQMDAERPIIYATLQSNHLDFDDLGLLIGAPPGTGPGESASPQQESKAEQAKERERVLPTATFDVPQMRAVDARVKYTAQEVEAAKLPLEGVTLELKLEDGVMTVKPLRFDLADGKLEVTGRVHGQSNVVSGQIDLTAKQIRLNKLLSSFEIDVGDIEVEKEGVGTLGGRANLEVEGNSIHDMAASADGELLVIMNGGKISSLILEGIGLDVGELVTLLFSDNGKGQKSMVPVQCFVSQFAGARTGSWRPKPWFSTPPTARSPAGARSTSARRPCRSSSLPIRRIRACSPPARRSASKALQASQDRRDLGATGREEPGGPGAGGGPAGDRRGHTVHRGRRNQGHQLRPPDRQQ